jgi:hypothetical protein
MEGVPIKGEIIPLLSLLSHKVKSAFPATPLKTTKQPLPSGGADRTNRAELAI